MKLGQVLFFLTICYFNSFQASAQETWSLEKCITYALQNMPTIEQAKLDAEIAALDYAIEKRRRLPTLTAGTSLGVQLGRTIDPTTNSFDNNQIGWQGINVQGSVLLFSAGELKQRIQRQKHLLDNSIHQLEENNFLLKLDVLTAYLSVLLEEEQLQQALLDEKAMTQQVEATVKQVEAGTRSVSERLELEAQLVNRQQLVTRQRNRVTQAYVALKNQMALPLEQSMQLEATDVKKTIPILPKAGELQQLVRQNYPGLLAQAANVEAAESDIGLAKTAFFPRISLFGDLRSNYSTVAMRDLERISYWDQINENFGQGVGISINIPIYNRGWNNITLQQAKLSEARAKATYENSKQQLNFLVQQAILDANNATEIYEQAQENVAVNKRLLENKAKEYKVGVTNQLDYLIVQNQYQNAVRQLISAKYDYLFRNKILAFYSFNSGS